MNTDTPETDQWEAYCDECYYHMWRLRRKTERGWHDGFHIHTGEEAKGLCDLLNKLERERDEARGQRDRLLEEREQWRISSVCRELVEQRDRLAADLRKVVTSWDEATWLDDNEFESFRESLQSLTPNAIGETRRDGTPPQQ